MAIKKGERDELGREVMRGDECWREDATGRDDGWVKKKGMCASERWIDFGE